MTRQLVDVLREVDIWARLTCVRDLVASLLTDGPAEHTIICPTCHGKGYQMGETSPNEWWPVSCPDCTNGRHTVIVRAEVKR